MEKIFDITGKLEIDSRARQWCLLPYPGHKKGCPMFNKKDICPPKVQEIDKFIDLNKKHWFAVVSFSLHKHMEKMKINNPTWTDKQLRNCLYWQGTVRKKLRILCENFAKENEGVVFNNCPEAMGVHVFKTARKIDIPIKKNVDDIVYKIAIIGYPNGS